MNGTERNLTTDERGAAKSTDGVAGGVDSVARRRALLKGMGSGAALAAAAAPLPALATGGRKKCYHKNDWKPVQATISGVQSVITSGMVANIPESPGMSCSHYKNSDNWPGDSAGKYCYGSNGKKFARTALYKTVFNCGGGGYNDREIRDIMNNQYDCPQRHWITACLNATKFGARFSYTAKEIVDFHNNAARNLDALHFFMNYQENDRS